MSTPSQLESNANHDHDAAKDQVRSYLRVMGLLGSTYFQAEQNLGLDRITAGSAFSGLREDGEVMDSGRKRMGGRGKEQAVWVLGDDRHVVRDHQIKHGIKHLHKLDRAAATQVITTFLAEVGAEWLITFGDEAA